MGIFDRFFSKPATNKDLSAEVPTANQPVSPAHDSSIENKQPDVNKPVENPKLKQLFERWKISKSDIDLDAVLEEIALHSWFITVFESSKEFAQKGEKGTIVEKDTILSFPMISDTEGHAYQPVFTDWNELGKWSAIKEPPKTMIFSFDDLHVMISKLNNIAGFVINPYCENFVVTQKLMASLKQRKDTLNNGTVNMKLKEGESILLGDPAVYPTQMIQAVVTQMEKMSGVSVAWFRQMKVDNNLSYLLVVDYIGDRESIFSEISQVARPYLHEMNLGMVPLDNFGRQAIEGVKPFYKKNQ